MVTLEIVTAVGTVQPSTRDAHGARGEAQIDPDAKLLRTRVDLLQGDITTELDPAFVTGDYREFRAFHAERERQAVEIVKSNIEVVRALLSLIQDGNGVTR